LHRKYSERPIIAVAALIINQNKEIVLIRRGVEPGKGLWSIPGGAVELGETLIEALKREIREETGLLIDPIELLDVVDIIKRDYEGRIAFHYVTVDYIARVIGGELRAASDVVDVRWVKWEDIGKYKTTNTFRRLISRNRDKILKYLDEDQIFKKKNIFR